MGAGGWGTSHGCTRMKHGQKHKMKKTRRPLVLKVKGRAQAVIMDPAVYQRLAERFDAVAGIQRGLAQAKLGMGRSVDEVFDAIAKE